VVLAEILDKEPGTLWLWFQVLMIGAIALWMSRIRWWGALLVLPGAGFLAVSRLGEFYDPHVGPAIRSELGIGYVLQTYAAVVVGALLPLAAAFLRRRASAA
jgi:hypothetical protein